MNVDVQQGFEEAGSEAGALGTRGNQLAGR